MTATSLERMPGLGGLAAESPRLEGKVVLVTGGSMGIGQACAEEALAAGAAVVIAARGREALAAAARLLEAGLEGGRGERHREGHRVGHAAERVHAIAADVGRQEEVEALVEAVVARLGGIDGLVHAAAVPGPIGPALDVDPEAWVEALRINVAGTYLVARAVGRAMRAGGGGAMVLLSGGGATSAFPRYTAYASSKAAVVRFAESLALELEPHGIRVNSLAPGFVATRIHEATLQAGEAAGAAYLRATREQLAGGGVPARLAGRAAAFLLSDRAGGITGRLVSAPWDRWWEWPDRRDEVAGSDLFTLRRIVPRDRGGDWQ